MRTELLVEDLDEGGQAVGGAGGVTDDGLVRVVVLGIDAHHEGGDVPLPGGRDQHLLRPGLDVLPRPFPVHEHPRPLDHQVDAQFPVMSYIDIS